MGYQVDEPAQSEAVRARDAGMQRAAEHAEQTHRGWNERAFDFLRDYAMQNAEFISEDVSDASLATGFPQPPTLRAWGSVYRRAIREDVIIQTGSGRSRRRHATICPRWGSLIYKGPRA
jgi:hypothetical protein